MHFGEFILLNCNKHAYLNLTKVFDSVNRKLLFNTMMKRGVDADLIRIIKLMYSQETSAIIMNGRLGEWLNICKGVRQGGCSSPICFNIIPNELARKIAKCPYGVKLTSGRKVGILLFADYIVLIAPNEKQIQ